MFRHNVADFLEQLQRKGIQCRVFRIIFINAFLKIMKILIDIPMELVSVYPWNGSVSSESHILAIIFDERSKAALSETMQDITGVENPNSVMQMKAWLSENGVEAESLGKKDVAKLIDNTDGQVEEALRLRLQLAKSSVKKYQAMQNDVCKDGRAHGMFQFYEANRSGRWADLRTGCRTSCFAPTDMKPCFTRKTKDSIFCILPLILVVPDQNLLRCYGATSDFDVYSWCGRLYRVHIRKYWNNDRQPVPG